MDRRSFLKAILGAAAYEPAKKIFVFAPACGWNSSLIVPGESMFFLESTALPTWIQRLVLPICLPEQHHRTHLGHMGEAFTFG